MRNLKRALSLTLASVMLLGMMVVGAGAAGFPDVDEDNANIEAIEVLQAVEVMIGDDNGNFGPDDLVNRSQMAVVMAKLLNLDYQYYEASCDFWDVPTWARPYVGACYANKIVSGYGDGTYGAADPVTPVQAASMMMRALGYFQYSEDYQAGFETATVRQGTEIGIFDGVGSSATASMTRSQVARMALNALESEMVTFTGTPGVTVGDATIGYRAEYTPRTSTETKYQAIEQRTSDVSGGNNLNRGQYYIQLGEELYNGKLTKKYDTDDFERPSINWQFNGKEIGVYVDYDLLVAGGSFTSAVKYSELYNLLTFTTINDNSLYRYVDGVDQKESKDKFSRSNKDEVGGTGVLTEVFYNQDREEIIITSINTYLAKANSDYNKTNETLSLKVYETNGTGTTKIVDSEDVAAAADVEKDEFRLVYMSGKNNAAKLEVVKIFDVEVMTDSQITKWSKHDTKVVDKLTTEGTEYKTNPKAYYDKNSDVLLAYNEQRLTNTSYNIFMDRYDNVIGVDLYEGTKNYVFITGYDRIQSNISVKTADAAAIFMDGTMDIITVNVTDSDKNIRKANSDNYIEWSQYSYEGVRDLNRWYTYTQAANGNYTLKPVDRFFYTSYEADDFDTKGVKVLNTANLYLNDSNKTAGYDNKGRIYGNDDSVYITVEPGYVDTSKPTGSNDAITDVKGVYTGAQDVKLEITTTSKELVNERKGDSHATSVFNGSVNWDASEWSEKVDYDKWDAPYEQNAYVYSVYDSNYYIIASVVLGDAQGATANYAYILGDAKSEWVEHGDKDDTYFWEFEAVLNGEKQTLTVKSKYEDTIDDLKPYHVQELRFDGDYVTAIKDVDQTKIMDENDNTKMKADEYDIYDVGHVNAALADSDAAIYYPASEKIHTSHSNKIDWTDHYDYSDRIHGTIELVGRTLYTERPDDVGLALTSNAKAVLIQKENKSVETIQCDSVSEAIGRLADANDKADGIQFHGRIVAVLDSAGAAKWVVIISDTLLLTGNQPSYGNDDKIWMELIEGTETEGHYWKLHVPYSKDIYSRNPSSDEIAGWLADAGCTEISKDRIGWNFVRRGVTHTNQAVEVVWCGWDHIHDNTVPVTGVTLDKDTATIKVGETVTLNATVIPAGADNKAVRWTTSDKSVATVSATGVVTGVKAGTATITVTTVDGGHEDSCVVTVKAETPEGETATVAWDSSFTDNGAPLTVSVDGVAVDLDKVPVGKDVTIATNRTSVELTVVGDGATKNDDGTWNVKGDFTVKPANANHMFAPPFGWVNVEGGGFTPIVTMAVTAKSAPVSRFSLARAAGGETPITPDPNGDWLVDVLAKNQTVEIRVQTEAYGTVTLRCEAPQTSFKFVVTGENEGNTLALMAALNGLTAEDTEYVVIGGTDPVEPTDDPRALPVQATLSTSTVGSNETATFSVYFGDKTERTITKEEIAAALTAARHPAKAANVDIEKQSAKLDTGATVTWENIGKDGVTTKTTSAVGKGKSAPLFKVTYLTNTYYVAKSSGDELPVADKTVKYFLSKEDVRGTAKVLTVVDGKITVSVSKDTDYVQAFPLVSNVDMSGGELNLADAQSSGVVYNVFCKGADGKVTTSAITKGAATVQYIQKDAVISFEASTEEGDQTCVKDQVITVKVNDVVVGKYEVTKSEEAPALKDIKITAPADTTDKDTDGKVALSFEISKAPTAEDREKHVFLNGEEIKATGIDEYGEPTYTLTGVKNAMEVVVEVTKKEGLKEPAGDVEKNDDDEVLQDKNQLATYTWDDSDAVPTVEGSDDPLNVYLYTAWAVTVPASGWTASRGVDKYGELDTTTEVNMPGSGGSGTTYYFKTEGTPATIYIQAEEAGQQLWFKDTKSADGMAPKTNAGVNLNKDKEGIWEVTVNRSIASTDIEAAYQIKGVKDSATYASGAPAALKWGSPVNITVKVNDSDVKGKIVKVKEFVPGKDDKNTYTYEVTSDGVSLRPNNADKTVVTEGALSEGKLVLELIGGYVIELYLTPASS